MKRFFRILKWGLLGLLAIAGIFLIVNGIRTARASHRLNEKIAALRAAGEPTSLADLARQPISPERNAQTYLCRAEPDVEAIHAVVYAAYRASSAADRKAADDLRPTPAYLESMRAALAAYPKVFPLVEEASHCPEYDPPFDFDADADTFMANLLPPMQSMRSIARLAEYRVLVQLDDGHPEEALLTCLTLLRLTRLFDRNPTLVSQLVSIAIRGMAIGDLNLVLRSGPLSQAAYAALEQELALHDMVERYRHALLSERAFGLQSFHEMAALTSPGPSLFPWFKNDECHYLDLMARCIQGVTLPYSQWQGSLGAEILPLEEAPITNVILPATQSVHNATFRTIAQLRALRVLSALLAREQAGGTGEPALAELGLPPDVVADPYNGEPLHLKKLPAGWVVYSVGQNLKDDGGDLTEQHDVGVGPPQAAKIESEEPAPPENPAG